MYKINTYIINMEEDKYYTNNVAQNFKEWNRNIFISGIITIILVGIIAIYLKSLTIFIIGLVIFTFIIMGSLIFLALAEIIQKLQNIEDNTRK